MLVAAVPAVASAAPATHRHAQRAAHVLGRRAHTTRCTLRHAHGKHASRAACRGRRLRHSTTSGTTTPSVATITSGPAPGSVTTSTSASFSFTRTGTGPFRCSLDGAPYALCSSPTALRGLTTGTHTFSVYAFNDSLIGPPASVAWSVIASTAAPSVPTGLAATAGDTQVSLSWNGSASSVGIAGYRVFRNGSQVAQVTSTTDTDTGLTDGVTYSYAVAAVDTSGAVSALSSVVSATPQAPAPTPTTFGSLSFQATFDSLLSSPLVTPQCANYGTPSQNSRYRGTWNYDSTIVGQGTESVRIDVPTTPSGYSLTNCNDDTPATPNVLGADSYQGIMVYVPQGWTIPNSSKTGVNFLELHFQNVYGAPLTLQLHPNSVVLALQTGACSNYTSTAPGCQYRGNLSCSKGTWTCEPTTYAIPPGAFVQGQWNEIIVHTHWSACGGIDACIAGQTPGSFDVHYRVKGASTWNAGSSLANIPTVQWDAATGSSPTNYRDQYELYTAAVKAPLSIWLDDVADGSSFQAVASQLP